MTHEKFEGERTLMRIHIGESDKWHGKPLYEAIVEMLRKDGFSGVTVLRGVAGYGGSSIYHTDKILRLSQDLPIILEVIEYAETNREDSAETRRNGGRRIDHARESARDPVSRRKKIANLFSLLVTNSLNSSGLKSPVARH